MKIRAIQLVLLTLLIGVTACKGTESTPVAAPAAYQGRGVVRQMPTEGAPSPELWIRHESIPEFVDIEGNRVGMDSMTMPFRLEPGVSLVGLEAGEKVMFELTVDWEANVPIRITDLEELAPEVELVF